MKYLKLILAFFVTTLLLTDCSTDNDLKPQKAIITGKILNLDKNSKNRWIKIACPDLFSNCKHDPFDIVGIDSNGFFRYEVDLISPSFCCGVYHRYFHFVISPGDSLNIAIDTNILSISMNAPLSLNSKYVKITGTVKDDYDKIINFSRWASDSIYTHLYHQEKWDAIKTKSPKEYKVFLCNRETEALKHIERIGKKQNTGEMYYKLLEARFMYQTFHDMIRYWWLHPVENGKSWIESKIPDNYILKFRTSYYSDNQ